MSRSNKLFPCILTGLLLYLLLALLGCMPAAPPDPPPAIRGAITQRSAGSGDHLGSILVEGQIENGTSFDKAAIAITGKTRIFERIGPEYRQASVDTLQTGRQVEAWFDGPVAESYPVQATASDIVILK